MEISEHQFGRPPRPALPGRVQAREDDVHILRVWGFLRRNILLILGCALLTVTGAAIVTARSIPVYEAAASIRIDDNQSGVPALEILRNVSTGNALSTEIEVLRSRALAEAVADSLGLQLQLVEPAGVSRHELFTSVTLSDVPSSTTYGLQRQPDGRFLVENRTTGLRLGLVAPGERIQLPGATLVLAPGASRRPRIEFQVQSLTRAVDALRAGIQIDRPVRDADIVSVRYQSNDPQLARDVPNAMTMHFIARRQGAQQTEARSTVTFLHEQIDRLSTQLAKAEDEFRTFREGHQVVDLQEEGRSQVSHVADVQAQRGALDAERSALSKLLDDVRATAGRQRVGEPSAYRNLVAFPTLLRNQLAAQTLASIAVQDERRADLLTRRTPEDPEVQLLNTRINQMEQQLRTTTEAYLQGLTNQVASLDATLAQSAQQLGRFPAKEVQFARLQRQTKVLGDLYTLLQTRLKEAEIAAAAQDGAVRLVDGASLPRRPIKPKPMLNIVLAAMTGLLLGVSAASLREYSDRSVRSRRDVQLATGAPVLGLIPNIRTTRKDAASGRSMLRPYGRSPDARRQRRLGKSADGDNVPEATPNGKRGGVPVAGPGPKRLVLEAYSRLHTNIAFTRPDSDVKTVVFTSPQSGDGKTTTATNLALTIARRGDRVLLIDADMRRGLINVLFGVPREPGLADVLCDSSTLGAALRSVDVEAGRLDFLTTGAFPAEPAKLLGSTRMRALLQDLATRYDTIILDSPPTNVVTDALALSAHVDGVVVVARAGVTALEALMYTMEQLQHVRAPILGTVLNGIDFKRDSAYDSLYRHYGYNDSYYKASVD